MTYPIEFWLDHDIHFDMVKRLRGKDNQHTRIVYGFGEAWFGSFLVAFSEQGLCWFEPEPKPDAHARLLKHWAPATIVREDSRVQQQLVHILNKPGQRCGIHLCGTDFQLRVWEALLCVPRGGKVTYGDLATLLGNRKAARALGNAVGANHIALLVPCHRVVPLAGGTGKYRWGSALKQQLLDRESHTIYVPGLMTESTQIRAS